MKRIAVESLIEHLEDHDALATVSYRDDNNPSYCGVRFDKEVVVVDKEGKAHFVPSAHTLSSAI